MPFDRAKSDWIALGNRSIEVMERAMKALDLPALSSDEKQTILDGMRMLTQLSKRVAEATQQRADDDPELFDQMTASAERMGEELERFSSLVDRLLKRGT